MNKKTFLFILLILVIYITSTTVSYALFLGKSSKTTPILPGKNVSGNMKFDTSLPKTESCPLNGALYSKQQREWWEKHRPMGIMIENHEEARPQSGLLSADVIYEAVAEGGITRFLAVFYCQDALVVGPVRSARTYFIEYISEYGDYPLYVHVGGANTPGPANALGQLADYGWNGYNDLNQFSIGYPTFRRDYDRLGHTVATEHTMYSATAKLWDFAAKDRKLSNVDEAGVGWDKNFVHYKFKEDTALKKATASNIHLEFWEGYSQFFVDWKYDHTTNSYKRVNGGKPHEDLNTKKQLTAKNIVVLFLQERNANDGYENNVHLLYKTKGTGKATIFLDGDKITGTWGKDTRTSKTLLFDANGSPLSLNKGTIWFEILPLDGKLVIQ